MYKRGYGDYSRDEDKGHNAPSSSSPSFKMENDASFSSLSTDDEGSEQDWHSSTSSQSSSVAAAAAAKRARFDTTSYLASPQHPRQHQFGTESTGGQKSMADEERRRVRRERNKLAAARCRQRRVDLTNTLLAETEVLEKEKSQLEKEIESLYRQTHELQYVLDSHSKRCPMVFDSQMPTSATTSSVPVDLTAVKTEKPDVTPLSQKARSQCYEVSCGISRPNSLPISSSLASKANPQFQGGSMGGLTEAHCPPLTLDFLAEGHTGLTPITGLPSAVKEVSNSLDCCLPSQTLNQTLMNL